MVQVVQDIVAELHALALVKDFKSAAALLTFAALLQSSVDHAAQIILIIRSVTYS